MKKITLALSLILTLLLISCEVNGLDGRDGFDGLDGLDGQDGVNVLSKVIDIEGDFNVGNDYSIFYEFDSTIIEVFETDVVLVYILFDQTQDSNGENVDVWRLLPQTRILDQGLLQYNFDHTFLDVNVFLESDFDLATLTAGDTDNQVFRIAVIPAESTGKSSVDKTDINAVLSSISVAEKDIKRIQL